MQFMNQHLHISITSKRGVFQFSLSQKHRRWLMGILCVGFCFIVVMTAMVFWLQNSVADLTARKHALTERHEAIQQQLEHKHNEYIELSQALRQERIKLQNYDSELSKIEENIRLENDYGDDSLEEFESRLRSTQHTIDQRRLILSTIPSGLPLNQEARVSSSFGWRIHPFLKKRHLHKGIDLAVNIGTPIRVTANGIVEFSGYKGGYGRTVVVNHGYGFKTLYAHLQKMKVKKGQVVTKGDTIAISGNTGRSTGPHLHYEVQFLARALNPKEFMQWSLYNYDSIFNKIKSIPWDSLIHLLQIKQPPNPTISSVTAADSAAISN